MWRSRFMTLSAITTAVCGFQSPSESSEASQLSDDSGRNYALEALEFGTLGSASRVASYTSTSIRRNSDLSLTEL
jgi:hypothetical protein